jgi:diguanylate cyclase (GGDEF)-like protein
MSPGRPSLSKRKVWHNRLLPWLAALLSTAVCLAGVAQFDRMEEENRRQELRLVALSRLATIRARLEGSLNSILLLSHGLASVIAGDPRMSEEKFGRTVNALLSKEPLIHHISIAHDYVVTQVYPLTGNEAEVGQSLLGRVDFREAVIRAAGTRRDVVAGPFKLADGAVALAGRTPVYLSGAASDRKSDKLWGMISLVVDLAEVFRQAELDNPNLPMTVAVRGRDGLGPFGAVFFGDGRLFASDSVRLDVSLPGGRWQLAAVPKSDAPGLPAGRWRVGALGLLVTALAGALSFAIVRYSIDQRLARKRLSADLSELKAQQARIERLVAHERTLSAILHHALQTASIDEFLEEAQQCLFDSAAWSNPPRCVGILLDGEGQAERIDKRLAVPLGEQSSRGDGACPVAIGEGTTAPCRQLHAGPSLAGEARAPTMVAVVPGRSANGRAPDTVQGKGVIELCGNDPIGWNDDDRTFFNRAAEVIGIGIANCRNETEIANLAFRDPLTELPNRRMLINRLQHEISVAARLAVFGAVIFIDLDRFKQLNDALGHSFGDALLIQVARRLAGNLRESDTVSRVGGDEFIVVLPGLSAGLPSAATGTYNTADKLRRALCEAYDLNGHVHAMTASMGIALFPHDATDVESLLKHAETAMYHAKAEGRNAIRFFEPTMQQSAEARLELENRLRQALNRGEFSIAYQPLVRPDGTFIGGEALLRWHDPGRGNIPPADFIPVAEETGLIVEIGRWVLESVARQVKAWEDEGLIDEHHHFAVNISPRQFHQIDFAAMVMAILKDESIDPARLVLEITEGVLIKDATNVVFKMEQLHNVGIRFYIDDFGTGYSSMTYLKRLPVHGLKIDRSFVQDLTIDHGDAAIIEAIISIARRFNLVVIAEGVETESQLSYLLCQGCSIYQGYYFSRPVSAEDLAERYLRRRSAGDNSGA